MADRVQVPLLKNPRMGVFVNPRATEGATLGENLFDANGNAYTIQTLAAAIVATLSLPASSTPATAAAAGSATPATGGSNSGYNPLQNPAAAPTNYDLDASMIAGLNNPQFPTLNYILVGNGAAWVAVPLTGDASIVASGVFKSFPGANMAASAVMAERRVRYTANNVAGTLPVPASDFQDQYILIESALTGCSVVANAGYTVNGLASWNLDITPCYVHLIANTGTPKNWFVAETRFGTI